MKGKSAELRELMKVKELLTGRLDEIDLQIKQLGAAFPDSEGADLVQHEADGTPALQHQLARMLDHDVRSPIAAIMTGVGLLRGGLPEEERDWVLRLLDHQSAELLEQVQNYLSLSHPEGRPWAARRRRTTQCVEALVETSSTPAAVSDSPLTNVSAILPQVLAAVKLRFAERCPEFVHPTLEPECLIFWEPDECALLLELVVADVVRRASQEVPLKVSLVREAEKVSVLVEDPGGLLLRNSCNEDEYSEARLIKSLGVVLAQRICAEQGAELAACAAGSEATLELRFPAAQPV